MNQLACKLNRGIGERRPRRVRVESFRPFPTPFFFGRASLELLENARAFAARETRIAPSCPPDKLQPVKATMPELQIVTRQGQPVSVMRRTEEEALKKGMEEKSRDFTEKGSELYAKA